MVLAGCCVRGGADAARDRARDAGLEDQLAAQQATRTVQRYFPPTGTPAPTSRHRPRWVRWPSPLVSVRTARRTGATPACPPGAGTVYVATRLTGLSVGQKVRAIVTDAWGNEVARPEVVIDPGAADRWLALPVAPSGRARSWRVWRLRLCRRPSAGVAGVRCHRRGNVGATSAGAAGQSPGAQHGATAGAAPAAGQPTPAEGRAAPTVAPSG